MSALLLALALALPADAPVTQEERRRFIAERHKEQNRLTSDLAVHTAASVNCARLFRLDSDGIRCWVWAFGFEYAFAIDQERGSARYARSVLIGPSPLTFGTWAFRDEHRFTDLEAAFVEPFFLARVGSLIEGEQEVGKFFGAVLGARAWVAWTVLRLGVEASWDFGPPGIARGPAVGGFVALAWHYAPLRADRADPRISEAGR